KPSTRESNQVGALATLRKQRGRSRAYFRHHQGSARILMEAQIKLGDIAVDVVFKDIKNVHLSVYPPNGSVRISAPSRVNLDTIRVFAISKLGWVKQQQKNFVTRNVNR